MSDCVCIVGCLLWYMIIGVDVCSGVIVRLVVLVCFVISVIVKLIVFLCS